MFSCVVDEDLEVVYFQSGKILRNHESENVRKWFQEIELLLGGIC